VGKIKHPSFGLLLFSGFQLVEQFFLFLAQCLIIKNLFEIILVSDIVVAAVPVVRLALPRRTAATFAGGFFASPQIVHPKGLSLRRHGAAKRIWFVQ
jgi:hypothetical protein